MSHTLTTLIHRGETVHKNSSALCLQVYKEDFYCHQWELGILCKFSILQKSIMQLNCASGYFIWKNMETQFKLEKNNFLFNTLQWYIKRELFEIFLSHLILTWSICLWSAGCWDSSPGWEQISTRTVWSMAKSSPTSFVCLPPTEKMFLQPVRS